MANKHCALGNVGWLTRSCFRLSFWCYEFEVYSQCLSSSAKSLHRVYGIHSFWRYMCVTTRWQVIWTSVTTPEEPAKQIHALVYPPEIDQEDRTRPKRNNHPPPFQLKSERIKCVYRHTLINIYSKISLVYCVSVTEHIYNYERLKSTTCKTDFGNNKIICICGKLMESLYWY